MLVVVTVCPGKSCDCVNKKLCYVVGRMLATMVDNILAWFLVDGSLFKQFLNEVVHFLNT